MRSKLQMIVLVLLSTFFLNFELVLDKAMADGFLGDPLLLKLVADQNEKNVLAIRCWQGTVEETAKRRGIDGTKIQSRRQIDFALDRQKDAWLWKTHWLEFSSTQGNKLLSSEPLNPDGGMIKENAYYVLFPYLPSSKRKHFVIRPLEEYSRNRGGFSPMEFLAADIGEIAYKRFGALYAQAMIGGAKTWTASRVGDIVKLSTRGEILNQYEVDLSKGANVVRYSADDGRLSEEIVTEYETIDGLWLPTRRVHKQGRFDGTESFHLEYKMKTIGVNHSMYELTISLESLGAVSGDKMTDRRDGSEHRFGQ